MIPPSILIVGDDPLFREITLNLLKESSYLVQAADSCEKARTALNSGDIDVLLFDLNTSAGNGLELLHYSRTLDHPPEVILVTEHITLETAIQTLKSGARDYLVKPFKSEELLQRVHTCVEQRQLLIENTQLKDQLRLYQQSQNLVTLIEIDQLLTLATAALVNELGPWHGFAFLTSSDAIIKTSGHVGVTDEEALSLATALLPQFQQLEGLKTLSTDDLPPIAKGPEHLQAVCLYPLKCDRLLKGGIILFNAAHNGFSQKNLPVNKLQFLAEQTALGFENALRFQGARELIYTDDLTGLFNYRYLQIILDQEIRRTERYGLAFSLIFIDLDRFKEINDTRGHLIGSDVLRELGKLLRENVREVDILFRYGGDEFTALLVETDNTGAAIVAERIRKSIEDCIFQTESNQALQLTATVGYASFPENASDKKSILDMADRAMYAGKKERNVVRGAWEIASL